MAKEPRHIIAIGGLSPTDDNAPLLEYALRVAEKSRPNLGFIGTASGDAEAYVRRFYGMVSRLSCEPSHLPLFGRTPDLEQWIEGQDVILVGGGNTKSMLAVWKEWGLSSLLGDAWQAGTVLAGWSAGAICWFEQGVTDSWATRLEALDCLGLLPGSCCPHYSGEPDRRPEFHRLLAEKRIWPGIAIDDCAAVHFIDDQPRAVLTMTDEGRAYQVESDGDHVTEQPLPVERILLQPDSAT